MKIIGITGTIGSGKSFVSSIFSQHGIPVIDTDEVYHKLISHYTETVKEIVDEFGESVLDGNGAVDRRVLGKIVFSDAKKLSKLNEITHKHVHRETLKLIDEYGALSKPVIAIEVPLMFESGFDKLCDEVICVVASRETCIKRIMKRNGISEIEAKNRIKNQKDSKFYIAKSSKVVYNNEDDDVYSAVNRIIEQL